MLTYVLAVEALALVSIPAVASQYALTGPDWVRFALLLGTALGYQEAARGIERVREFVDKGVPANYLLSVWLFAAVLLLPPSLTAVLIAVGYVHAYFRVYRRRMLVYRKVFTAATVVLACVGAYLVLSVIYPAEDPPFALVLDGPLGLAAVVAAALVYRLVNYVLVVVAIVATNLDRPARHALGSAADQLIMASALGLGGAVAVVMTVQPWFTPLLVLTVLGLHMGLLVPQFRDASRNDAKTGLFDAVFWAKLVTDELDRARRLGGPAAVLVIDLDHFKLVNDRHGHLAGDAVLRAVSEAIRHSVRGHDTVGRYGGEEFAVMLPAIGVEDVLPAAERIRRAIAAVEVTTPDLHGTDQVIGGLTASVGAAVFPEHGTDRTTLLLAADAALYAAKDSGRDRVHLAAPVPRPGTHRPAAERTVPR